MRFLIDEALQDRLAERLADAGHDASHVRVIGMQGATDEDVLARRFVHELHPRSRSLAR